MVGCEELDVLVGGAVKDGGKDAVVGHSLIGSSVGFYDHLSVDRGVAWC